MKSSGREAALTALQRCRKDGAWSGEAIDRLIKKYELDRREAALASRLCLGVLQNSSCLDYYIDFYRKGATKLEPKLRDILRLGAYQLMFLDKIPESAAVNESVALSKKSGFSRASGLVNAILRRIAENKDKLPEIPGKGSAQYLSIKYSHPLWLCKRIIEEKGYDFAEEFLQANNSASYLNIQVNRLKISVPEYEKLLDEAEVQYVESDYPEGCLELKGGNVSKLPGFEEGLFYVQDKAARIAAEIAGAKPGMRVMDCCAAPGGKSFASAINMENRGSILSCDIHEKKLGLIKSGAERLGVDIISTRANDARKPDESLKDSFQLVIADVPCSGLGVIGKKPEIRQKDETELNNLPAIQRDILNTVSKYVEVGGCLLYSTCTVLKCENEDIVENFLKENPDFEAVDFSAGHIKSDKGMYTFWPNKDGCDGFFAAKMRRIK